MPRHPRAAVVLAIVLAACGGGPTPPPSAGGSPAPASAGATAAPATPAPSPSPEASAAPSPLSSPGPLDDLAITTEPFTQVAGSALSMIAPDDGTGRVFVGNQEGQIWVVERDGAVQATPLVDLDARIQSGGEQGLLGIALHPAFPTDPRLFVHYSNNDGDTVIGSLTLVPGDSNRFDPNSFEQLLFIDQPYPNHNGGSIQFGANGYLTIAMGDGGSGGDPHENGQNPDALLGKVLRIDVDGGTAARPYGIPPENPFAGGGGAPEVWLLGMRNPWRTSFDRATGDFWIGDVGQELWEEIDVVRAGTEGALNFGWNVTEGAHCYRSSSCDLTAFVAPVAEYGHDLGCSVVGGYVYRGATYPFLVGTYLFSDTCSGRIWAIDASSDGPSEPIQVGSANGTIASFGEDAEGELYVLTLGGAVERIVATQG